MMDNVQPSPEPIIMDDVIVGCEPTLPPTNNYELVLTCKDSCKYCLGRGQERWLSARHKYSDGSVDEEFELRKCRRARYEIRLREDG